MKEKLLVCLLLLCSCALSAGAGKPLKYVDARTLSIVNKAQPTGPALQRLDVDRYPQLPDMVRTYFSFTTGLAVAFRTNSTQIHVRWTTAEPATSVNTTLITQSGMDLYIRREGQWVFAGVATPGWGNSHRSPVVENMDGEEKECLLYLPLFNRLDTLEIGVDPTADISPLPKVFNRKVVVIGSSITHGAAASRPGLAYPARLQRMLDCEFANLGACGLCKLEDFYTDIAGDTSADAFLFDAFSNPSARQIEERTLRFVERIRAKHPDTPLIFLQTEVRETGNFDLKKRAYEQAKRDAAEAMLRRVQEAGIKNVYFINPGIVLGDDHEATTDGVHPSDEGFSRMIEALGPKLRTLLEEHLSKSDD